MPASTCPTDCWPTSATSASAAASAALQRAFGARRTSFQATGGDDYELCFTAPANLREPVSLALEQAGVEATRIGRIVAGEGVRALAADGTQWRSPQSGYVHFG